MTNNVLISELNYNSSELYNKAVMNDLDLLYESAMNDFMAIMNEDGGNMTAPSSSESSESSAESSTPKEETKASPTKVGFFKKLVKKLIKLLHWIKDKITQGLNVLNRDYQVKCGTISTALANPDKLMRYGTAARVDFDKANDGKDVKYSDRLQKMEDALSEPYDIEPHISLSHIAKVSRYSLDLAVYFEALSVKDITEAAINLAASVVRFLVTITEDATRMFKQVFLDSNGEFNVARFKKANQSHGTVNDKAKDQVSHGDWAGRFDAEASIGADHKNDVTVHERAEAYRRIRERQDEQAKKRKFYDVD